MPKSRIEAIYPLTFMQKALLMHRLKEQDDQGLLQLQCTLEGHLDEAMFRDAWQQTVDRHPALRTSVHWEGIEQPVQVVHPEAIIPWTFEDWRDLPAKKQHKKLIALKQSLHDTGLDLTSAPVSGITLIRIRPDTHVMIWRCHHMLLDGWSASVILKDVLAFYDTASQGQPQPLPVIPSYQEYLQWARQRDLDPARKYWQTTIDGFTSAQLFVTGTGATARVSKLSFKNRIVVLPEKVTHGIQQALREDRVTLSTWIQALWGLLLSRYFDTTDIIFGATVSGRSGGMPDADRIAGLFMNVVPIRMQIEPQWTWPDLLGMLQHDRVRAAQFEDITLDQIYQWTDPSLAPLFDNILVVENFPTDGLKGGGITLTDLAGDITTTYPVTLIAKPGSKLELILRYDCNQVPEQVISWITESLTSLVFTVLQHRATATRELIGGISRPPVVRERVHRSDAHNGTKAGYTAPQNALELKLTEIWESVLGRYPIGVNDNFFELGGRSIVAIRLFSQIERSLQRKLPPTTLLTHPTIRELAEVIEQDQPAARWTSLVPIRASGSKPPLFGVHGGGAHVFFYKPLAHHLGPDQPFYALQPLGLDGAESSHQSIETMAAYYVDLIRDVQPEGPYALVSMCFGNPVAIEMARLLQESGETVAILAIVDSAPTTLTPMSDLRGRISPGRFVNAVTRGDWEEISYRMFGATRKIKRRLQARFASQHDRNLARMTAHLAKLFRAYTWTPYPVRVTLIRSSECHENPQRYHYQTDHWSTLAQNGLEVHVVPGHHQTLFEEPEVQDLAKQLTSCLQSAYSVHA